MQRSAFLISLFAIAFLVTSPASAGEPCLDWSGTLTPLDVLPEATGSFCVMTNDYIYIAGDRFLIIEIDTGGSSAVVGSMDLIDPVQGDMVIVGDRVYLITGGREVWEIDVGDPTAPVLHRLFGSDVELLDLAVLGPYIVASAAESRLHYIDVSGDDPLSATMVDMPDAWIDEIEVQDTTLVTLGGSISSYDVSDPLSPVHIDNFMPLFLPRRLLYTYDRVYYHVSTPDGHYYLTCLQVMSDKALEFSARIDIPSTLMWFTSQCADDRFLVLSGRALSIFDSTDLSTEIQIETGFYDDIALHRGILCAVDPNMGLKTWQLPDKPAVRPAVAFDAPGVGTGRGEFWVLNWGQWGEYSHGATFYAWYSFNISIFDIGNPLDPRLVHERSGQSNCDWYDCSPGNMDCHLSGTRWALYEFCREGHCSWRPFDLIGGDYLGSTGINGGVVYTEGDIVWCVDVWSDTIDKYELSVELGVQHLYGFDDIHLNTWTLHWLDESSFIHVSPTVKIYDLSDPAGVSISTAWPAAVPTDVTLIEVRPPIVYARTETTLYAIDVTDPSDPALLDELTFGAKAMCAPSADVMPVIVPDGTYLAHLDPDGGFAACSSLIEGHFEDVLPMGDFAYCHDGFGTLVFDLTDLDHPVFVGTGTGGAGGLMLKDGYLIDNAGVYLPHCGSDPTPTVLQTFDAFRDGSLVRISASLYGDFGSAELALWREAEGLGRVELVHQTLDDYDRFSWTDLAPPSSAAAYHLQVDGAWLGSTSIPAANLPKTVRLLPNVPNPFNPKTVLSYEMAQPGYAELTIFDARGRRVVTLLDGNLPTGAGTVEWDGRDAMGRALPSGSYLATLETNEGRTSRKLMLTR
jgi:hypothetical protein